MEEHLVWVWDATNQDAGSDEQNRIDRIDRFLYHAVAGGQRSAAGGRWGGSSSPARKIEKTATKSGRPTEDRGRTAGALGQGKEGDGIVILSLAVSGVF